MLDIPWKELKQLRISILPVGVCKEQIKHIYIESDTKLRFTVNITGLPNGTYTLTITINYSNRTKETLTYSLHLQLEVQRQGAALAEVLPIFTMKPSTMLPLPLIPVQTIGTNL